MAGGARPNPRVRVASLTPTRQLCGKRLLHVEKEFISRSWLGWQLSLIVAGWLSAVLLFLDVGADLELVAGMPADHNHVLRQGPVEAPGFLLRGCH